MIEICAVGGYNEVGRNMTAIKIDNEVVILDMGLYLDKYISCRGEDDTNRLSVAELIRAGAVPDDTVIREWRAQVKAIIPTHAHLDHVGAVPFMSNHYNAPIIGTPYTTEVINAILQDEKISLKNRIKTVNPNSSFQLSKNIEIEFINVTHSTPQTVMVAVHTKYGTILYANDYKFDSFPIIGQKTNMKRLKELGKDGKVLALIMDGTRAKSESKTPSESVAKEMLKDVLLGTENSRTLIIVRTFSSHIARLKSIIELGKKLNRKIMFVGRSLSKYVGAAEKIKIVNFSRSVQMLKYGKDVRRAFNKINSAPDRGKYMLVVTGHQGEPNSVLSKIASGDLPLKLHYEDQVIFSCNVIPTPMNAANREVLEEKLRESNVRIFKDLHVSGHASREDHRDLINLVKPKHIIPAHGDILMTSALSELAVEMGYTPGVSVHVMQNGQKIFF